MDIYQLPKQPFTSTGSQIENKLSNSFSNEIDLLVRESIQNSLDAVDKASEQSYVKVDYYLNEFDQENLLQQIDSFKLLKDDYKYKKALIIKDTGTIGVDGDPDKSNSSYYRLLFDSNNPQIKASSGGSSGEGKTLYYKLGIGLVVYYTRIKKGNSYESRLNISYMENEKVLLQRIPNLDKDSYTGICWWGNRNEASNNNVAPILPITDKVDIVNLLQLFNIQPFAEEETGTMVIIPFFKDKELLDVNPKYAWTNSVEDYLKHSVQKWYCFRLDNTRYPNGKYLKVSVNDEKVSIRYQFFKYLKKLYNQIYTITDNPLGSIKEIKLKKVDGIAGTLSYVVLKKEQVNSPNNIQEPTPFELLFNDTDNNDEEHPYVVYTRKLGMVINYTKPPFNNHIIKVPNDCYLIGVFSLNGEASLAKEIDEEKAPNIYNLEEYYRKMETSTHELWEDKRVGMYIKPFTFTSRIFNQIHSAIKNNLEKDTKNIKEVPIDLKFASKVGKAFMPNIGQPYMSNVQGGIGSGGGTGGTGKEKPVKHTGGNGFVKHKDKCSLSFTDNNIPIYTIYGTIKSYNTLYITEDAKKVSITVDLNSIQSKNPLQNYKEWEKNYPVSIIKLSYKDKIRDKYILIKNGKQITVEDDIYIYYDSNKIEVSSEKKEILLMDLLIEYSVDGVYETSITLTEEEVRCQN
jgi:hypothetical protein